MHETTKQWSDRMNAEESTAQQQRDYNRQAKRNQRKRYEDAGLVEKTVRIPNNAESYSKLLAFEKKLQKG